MIVLAPPLRAKLAKALERDGVNQTKLALECDEQTMSRAALGIPLRDDVAKRIARIVSKWEVDE